MPLFYYTNNHGKRERIFPLHFSDLTGFVIVENEQAHQLTVHRDCIECKNTEEEFSEARRKYMEKNYGHLFKEEDK